MNIFAAVCFISAVFSVLATVIRCGRNNIAESVTVGAVFFFFSYIFASMGLFVLDVYSLFRAGVLSLAINTVHLGAAVAFKRKKTFSVKELFSCDFSVKAVIIPIIVCIIAVPFISVKNEIFGMGQDQGVYQMQAIGFIYGDNDRQKDFDEYHKLETDEERESFRYCVENALKGYDIPKADFPESVYDYDVSPVSGIFHGIPTYTSMLAMWGAIFGIENMIGIESVFYVLMIFLVYFICRNLKLKKSSEIAACAAAASAPVVIWVAKASLTEMFLVLLPLMFIYFLTDDENPKQKWLSIIPAAVFACYHVSIYTIVPVFFLVYAGMYFFTREKQYAVLMPGVIAGYLASYFMMRHVQPVYTMNNYSPVFVAGINVHNITAVVTAACIAGLAASGVYIFILSRKSKGFSPSEFTEKAVNSKIFRIMLSLLLILPVVFIAVRALMRLESLKDLTYLTLWGFICNAGILLIPVAMAAAALKPKFFIGKNSRLVVFLMFFYCILVYSAVLRPEIQYYYYYSRYLAPFIPVAAIFAVMTLDRFGGKLVYPLTAAGLIFVLPFDIFLMNNKDDTRMEWSVLEDVASVADENDCILVERKYMDMLWLPLRSITGADVYPQNDELENQFLELMKDYDRVLFVSGDKEDEEDFSVLYKNKLFTSEDDLNHTGHIVPMSLAFWESVSDIYVYRYDRYQLGYTAAKDYDLFEGVSVLENDFFWTDEETVSVECGLYPADYDVTVSLGCAIPLEAIGEQSLDLTVYVNGEKADAAAVTADSYAEGISFEIDDSLISDGKNTITLECELWPASEVNPADTRNLGIPIKSLVFTEAAG